VPLNIAHRGARSLAPENTLAAANKAHTLGCDAWETDLAITADNELILFHDDSLARTTNVEAVFPDRAPGPFTDYTLAEIRTLDAGSWFAAKDPHGAIAAGEIDAADLALYKGERVPTLREALSFTVERNWRMNLELKRLPKNKADFPVVEHVLALVREMNISPRHLLFSAARHDWLEEIRNHAPEFALEALIGILPEDPMDYSNWAFDTYNIRQTRISEDEVKEIIGRGKAVNLYVVNDPKDIQRWTAAGAAGLITDFPQRLA
jgi:glycerophosphoryl diester phosphodiesterase